MSNRDVHVGRGGGYAWQWLLATDLTLRRVVLDREVGVEAIDQALARIGPVVSVGLEGDRIDGSNSTLTPAEVRLEDISIVGERGRLHIQAKVKQDSSAYWTSGEADIRKVRRRAAGDPEGLYLFASNVSVARVDEATNTDWTHGNFSAARVWALPRVVDDSTLSGELADQIARTLADLGSESPRAHMHELVMYFVTASIADGGHSFSLPELRTKIEELTARPGVPPIALGHRLLEDALANVPWPNYTDLVSGTFLPRPEVEAALAVAREYKLVVLAGPADQGKSVLARIVGLEAIRQDAAVVAYYDVLRDGTLARGVHGLLSTLRTHALVHRKPGWVIVDNPHAIDGLTDEAVDAWEQSNRELTLVLSTRKAQLRDERAAKNRRDLLQATSIELSLDPLNHGNSLARFWLQREHDLDGDALEAAVRVVSVPSLMDKGHLLREAIRAYDPARRVTSRRAIMTYLRDEYLYDLETAALEVLYVVSGLFRSEVRTDPEACRALIDRSEAKLEEGITTLVARGIIRQSEHDRHLSMAHETLARLYWIVLASEPTLTRLRRRFHQTLEDHADPG